MYLNHLLKEPINEGKSPHKKGTKKYKDHMAAMHAGMAEAEAGRIPYDPTADVQSRIEKQKAATQQRIATTKQNIDTRPIATDPQVTRAKKVIPQTTKIRPSSTTTAPDPQTAKNVAQDAIDKARKSAGSGTTGGATVSSATSNTSTSWSDRVKAAGNEILTGPLSRAYGAYNAYAYGTDAIEKLKKDDTLGAIGSGGIAATGAFGALFPKKMWGPTGAAFAADVGIKAYKEFQNWKNATDPAEKNAALTKAVRYGASIPGYASKNPYLFLATVALIDPDLDSLRNTLVTLGKQELEKAGPAKFAQDVSVGGINPAFESVTEQFVEYLDGIETETLGEKKDACYHKVKSRYKVWPSAYASGALVQCRKKGAKNWGNKSKKK